MTFLPSFLLAIFSILDISNKKSLSIDKVVVLISHPYQPTFISRYVETEELPSLPRTNYPKDWLVLTLYESYSIN